MMKQFNRLYKVLFCTLLISAFAFSQEKEEPTMFLLQTDHVHFNMMAQYEKTAKEFIAGCKEHKLSTVSWSTATSEDGRYMYVIPLENMATLDSNPMAELNKKMGEDKMKELYGKMDECSEKQSSEIIYYRPELSYNPEGYSREGMNSREWHFLHYAPKNRSDINDMMANIKTMFEAKGIKNGYNVYHSGIGSNGSYYIVSVAGKSAFHIAEIGKENNEALGEEGDKEFYKLMQLASKYDQVDGRMRPDMSYSMAASE